MGTTVVILIWWKLDLATTHIPKETDQMGEKIPPPYGGGEKSLTLLMLGLGHEA